MILEQICNPSPIPCLLSSPVTLPNILKSLDLFSSEIPGPVSLTEILKLLELNSDIAALIVIPPFLVNLRALETRLIITYLSLLSS